MNTTRKRGRRLRPREYHVIAGVARGLTNAEIGRDLGISPLTVKTHLERISAFYGLGTRAGIVGEAYRRGDLAGLRPEPREQLRFGRATLAVLDGIAHGLTNPMVAAARDRSADTVDTLLYRLLKRLEASNAAHAVALGYQHGYLPLPQQAGGRAA